MEPFYILSLNFLRDYLVSLLVTITGTLRYRTNTDPYIFEPMKFNKKMQISNGGVLFKSYIIYKFSAFTFSLITLLVFKAPHWTNVPSVAMSIQFKDPRVPSSPISVLPENIMKVAS